MGWALLDTGASTTCIDGAVLRSLSVPPIGVAAVGTAGGQVQQGIYPAALRFPGMDDMQVEFSSVLGVDLGGHQTPSNE
ncbi:MAG: hypothetical protein WD800_00470, partial [Dehalococcoidia bacterium]